MTARVNFLEKGKYVLTYKNMVRSAALLVVGCLSIAVVEYSYSWWLGRAIVAKKAVIEQLNIKKEKTMKMVEASKSMPVNPDIRGLADIYSHFPYWSEVLRIVAKNMPPQSWLSSIVTEYYSNSSLLRRIAIGGQARSTSSVTRLVETLNESPMFSNVILNKSTKSEKEEQKLYSFTILGEVRFEEKKWK